MHSSFAVLALGLTLTQASVLPRADYKDGPWMHVPTKARPDKENYYKKPAIPEDSNYFIHDETPITYKQAPPEYQSRPDDIPFGLLNKGGMSIANDYPHLFHTNDHANNTACGIPGSAYFGNKGAIHSWWLNFTPPEFQNPLTRWCMSDVCIAVWNETGFEKGLTDVIVKITDICSEDPSDLSYCESPADIMIERSKASVVTTQNKYNDHHALTYDFHYPRPVWWYFVKCSQDGVTNKAYNHTDNWWANPGYPNQWTVWSNNATVDQHNYNQKAYPLRKPKPLPPYGMGVLLTSDAKREAARFPIEKYWQKGDAAREWCPVAGGESHFAKATGDCPIKETAPLEAVSGEPDTTTPGGILSGTTIER